MAAERVVDRAALGPLTLLGRGGQGHVYRTSRVRIPNLGPVVFKEYKPEVLPTLDRAGLADMVRFTTGLPPTSAGTLLSLAALPVAQVEADGRTVGLLMPEAPGRFFAVVRGPYGSESVELAKVAFLLNPADYIERTGLAPTGPQRYALLREIAAAIALLHRHDVTVGDLSPRNLLFSLETPVTCHFIDCDSMTVRGRRALPHAETPGWGVPPTTGEPPGTRGSDAYKFGLLALRLLAGGQLVRDTAELPSAVPHDVRALIQRTLRQDPARRPTMETWIDPLAAAAGGGPGFSHAGVPPGRGRVPFRFGDGWHRRPETLAAHLAGDWDAARELVAGPGLERLASWLDERRAPPGQQRALKSCRTAELTPDRLVAELVTALDPALPAMYRGFLVERLTLTALVRAAVAADGPHRRVIADLAASRALSAYAGWPDCADHDELDGEWARNLAALDKWAAGTPQLRLAMTGAGRGAVAAELLEALLDPAAAERWRVAAKLVDTEEARACEWFATFRRAARRNRRSKLQPARWWAMAHLGQTAGDEYRRGIAVQIDAAWEAHATARAAAEAAAQRAIRAEAAAEIAAHAEWEEARRAAEAEASAREEAARRAAEAEAQAQREREEAARRAAEAEAQAQREREEAARRAAEAEAQAQREREEAARRAAEAEAQAQREREEAARRAAEAEAQRAREAARLAAEADAGAAAAVLLAKEAARRLRAMERDAADLLSRPDGPLALYHHARAAEHHLAGYHAAFRPRFPLPHLPAFADFDGAATDLAQTLTAVLPLAANRMEHLSRQVRETARTTRQRGRQLVDTVPEPEDRVPEPHSVLPLSTPPDPAVAKYEHSRKTAGLAATFAVLTTLCAAVTGLTLLHAIALAACLPAVLIWNARRPAGRAAAARQCAAQEAYEQALAHYRHERQEARRRDAEFAEREQRRQALLIDAMAGREQAEGTARKLDMYANALDRLAGDLGEACGSRPFVVSE